MNLHDFQTLLLNREEIEKALGVKIPKYEINDQAYLEDYAMLSVIPLRDVVAIFLGLNPKEYKKNQDHPRYFSIYKAIETAVRRKEIEAETEVEHDINGNEWRFDVWLDHNTAKAWATAHKLEWNVPPYKPVIVDSFSSIGESLIKPDTNYLETQNVQLEEENARLKAEIELLKSKAVNNGGKVANVDCEKLTIYGHFSENFEIIFDISKRISENCDIDNPHSYPTKEQIKEYVKRKYSDSYKLAESIYQIVTPEKVKNRGKTPKGVDTFQGFI